MLRWEPRPLRLFDSAIFFGKDLQRAKMDFLNPKIIGAIFGHVIVTAGPRLGFGFARREAGRIMRRESGAPRDIALPVLWG